ncbi:MAG: hypothetical protein J2P24_13030 [Streptosporangiales bacterium]|nr:hypothetical protein [Streptosporangiales bacterium]MBO0889491.1 hypothetical protein [Acidothermales bacterium]
MRTTIRAVSTFACVLALALVGSGCARHDEPAASRAMRFDLAATSAGPLAVDVPTDPVASAPTGTPGLAFELFVLRRSGQVVDVVFALHNTGGSDVDLDAPTASLDESPAAAVHAASAVALVDRKGLKEYLTFREDGGEGRCLCSETFNVIGEGKLGGGKRRYYAAVVAAPPPDVTEVTVKAGSVDIDSARITS